jgi:SAM-dependent methyltransferase
MLTAPLDADSADLVLLANVIHHSNEYANRLLFHRVAGVLRPGGLLVALDVMRARSVSESNQIEALMDLYFGGASGGHLWTVTEIQSWQQKAGLRSFLPVALRLLPDWKIQSARKPMDHLKAGC